MDRPHDNRRGILLVVTSMMVFTITDTLVKLVVRSCPYGEVIFVRGVFAVAGIACVLILSGEFRTIRSALQPMVGLRAFFDTAGSLLFIGALVRMPIAELYAVISMTPLLLTALAVVLYRAQVGWRRWGAIAIGFGGMLLVIKPTPSNLEWWAFLALGSAFASAMRDLVTQRIHGAIPPLSVTFISASVVMMGGLALAPFEDWRMLTLIETAQLAGAALFLALGTYLLVIALRLGEIAVVAPFRYTLLIWAGIAGYFVFGEWPDGWSILGAALIAASGLYTLHRETVRQRYLSAETPLR